MRNVYEVLREKECAVERVRKEIEALRLVSNLLAEHIERKSVSSPAGVGSEGHVEMVSQPGKALDGRIRLPVDDIENDFAKIRPWLVKAAGSDIKKRKTLNALDRFQHLAMRASRMLWRRVLDSRLWEHKLPPEVEQGWMEAGLAVKKSA